VHSWLILRF